MQCAIPHTQRTRLSAKYHLFALLFYSILACIVTWPLVRHINTHMPAIPGELGQNVWQHAWNMWWVKEALLVYHTNPYYTHMLFYPEGASLYLHSLNLPLGLLAIPLLSLTNIVITYNVLTLLVVMLSGYCTFLLARYVVGHNLAALIAGVVVLCSPQRLFELRTAQLAAVSDYGVPLLLLMILIALEHRTLSASILAAGVFLLAGLSKWYNVIYAFPALVMLFAWRMGVAWRNGKQPALVCEFVVWLRIAAFSTLFVMPFLVPVLLEAVAVPYEHPKALFGTDLLHLLPQAVSRLWVNSPTGGFHTFALLPLILALIGLLYVRRHVMLWVSIALVCLLLSFGPRLHVGNIDTGIPMPYALVSTLPIGKLLRSPYRINATTTLMIALVAAHGVANIERHVWKSLQNRWILHIQKKHHVAFSFVLSFGVILLIAVEAIRFPFPLVDATVSPFYTRIASEPGEWSILEFPFSRMDRDQLEMYTQTYHGNYILTGNTSRSMPRLPYESAPPIAQAELPDTRTDIVYLSPEDQQQLLHALRVRYLVVRPDPEIPGRNKHEVEVAQQLLGPLTEVYADAEMHVYRLDKVAAWLDGPGRSALVEMPMFVGLDSGWESLEIGEFGPGRWLSPKGVSLWVYTPRARRVVLDIFMYSLPGTRPMEVWVNGRHMQTLLVPEGLEPRHYIGSPISIPVGASHLTLRAPQGGVSPRSLGIGKDKRPLSFSVHGIEVHEVQ